MPLFTAQPGFDFTEGLPPGRNFGLEQAARGIVSMSDTDPTNEDKETLGKHLGNLSLYIKMS
jgi:hypothetical protein